MDRAPIEPSRRGSPKYAMTIVPSGPPAGKPSGEGKVWSTGVTTSTGIPQVRPRSSERMTQMAAEAPQL
jgi:hypothetical protein